MPCSVVHLCSMIKYQTLYHNIFLFESKIVANVPKSKEVWTINDSNGSIDFVRGILLPPNIYSQNIEFIELRERVSVEKDFYLVFYKYFKLMVRKD